MCGVFECAQWSSIPYSGRPIVAGGIEHISPTPFNDTHAGGVSSQSGPARQVRRDHTRTVPSSEDDAA